MRLEHYPPEKIRQQILGIAGKYLDLSKYRVFFFGSRVSGGGDERSDIDVGIEGGESLPPGILSDIQDELDNLHTLYKIEAVDFKEVSLGFRDMALQKIEEVKQ